MDALYISLFFTSLSTWGMVARGEAQMTTELPCGSPPGGIIPGVPVSNVHEPIPGDNVCRGTVFQQVQEIIWICDTLLCCQEPCNCDAGQHSERNHGCGELQPIADISCYVQQQQPIRWYSRVCCEGYEEDGNRMCIRHVEGDEDATTMEPEAQTTEVPRCVSSCEGRADWNYQSCHGCSVFASCVAGNLIDNRPCPGGLVWDDRSKHCLGSSSTCP